MVPGFDPVIPIQIPAWSNCGNVFAYSQAYLLYFRLQGKLNFHYNDRTRSGIFFGLFSTPTCLTQSLPYNPKSTRTGIIWMRDTYPHTCVCTDLRRASTNIQKRASMKSLPHGSDALTLATA